MCADFAIHDSVNDAGQRNLHFHLLLTMTPILEDGSWGKRQEKRHKLDKNGEWKKKANGKWDYEKASNATLVLARSGILRAKTRSRQAT